MEDVVALALELDSGETRYVITWGRIQSAVQAEPLEKLVRTQAHRFALGGELASVRLCRSLQAARDEPYFFEALISFAMQPIPFGDEYPDWRSERAANMAAGKELYFLGSP